MIVEHFDRRTMAAMEVALEKVCACWPCGGKHNVRKRVAQSIIRCAKTGNTTLDALTEAGDRALAQLPQSSKSVVKLKGADIRPNWQNAA
jgi:ribosomal protein L37AE/L43A